MKTIPLYVASLVLSAVAVPVHAACYTVLDAKGEIISQSPNPPVNMTEQLHETVPERFGKGATMIFSVTDARCGDAIDTWESENQIEDLALKSFVQMRAEDPKGTTR